MNEPGGGHYVYSIHGIDGGVGGNVFNVSWACVIKERALY